MESGEVKYDSENILWMTELPARSTSTPIIVGDRIFLMAEPDELICLDKTSGKILWTAANNLYEALSPAEFAAQPTYATVVAPLVSQLKQEKESLARVLLRGKIQEALESIDQSKFRVPRDGHFDAHFGIVGYKYSQKLGNYQSHQNSFGDSILKFNFYSLLQRHRDCHTFCNSL